jgi:predicted trehalose synthase
VSAQRDLAAGLPPADVLAAWLAAQRWFAAKTRRIAGIRPVDTVPLAGALVVVLEVSLDDGTVHRYLTPLQAAPMAVDALDDPEFGRALLSLIVHGDLARGSRGVLRGEAIVPELLRLPRDVSVRRMPVEQSNTSLLFGRTLILKFFRRHVVGINPDVEIGRFLTRHGTFRGTPRLAGQIEYDGAAGAGAVAILQEFVDGARDGWEWMLEQLALFFEQARTAGGSPSGDRVVDLAGPSLAALEGLGEATAGLHRALASDPHDPAFVPAPITEDDIRAWGTAISAEIETARAVLGDDQLPGLPGLATGLWGLLGHQKIRHHGDLHLGQTLYRPADREFLIIDFEGEPARPIEERRRRHAAVRDVAGLLRSLDYASAVAARRAGGDELTAWGELWRVQAERVYLTRYRATASDAAFVPATATAFLAATAVFALEKAAYEVVYEANHRPEWIDIPRRGLLRAAALLRRSRQPPA